MYITVIFSSIMLSDGCLPSSIANPPGNLVCTALSTTTIQCNWTDYSDNEAGFIIERAAGGAGYFEKIATVAPDTIVYDDDTCSAGTQYFYRVCAAMTSGGNTDYTNTSTAITDSVVQAHINPFDGGNDPEVVFENPLYDHTYQIHAVVTSETEEGKWTYDGESTYTYICGDTGTGPIDAILYTFYGYNYGQFALRVNDIWRKFSTREESDDTKSYTVTITGPWYGAMADEEDGWADNAGTCTCSITDITDQ